MSESDFCNEEQVIVTIPDDEDLRDISVFNPGWMSDMYKYVGCTGTIIGEMRKYDIEGYGSNYKIRFEDGSTWWWDERYIMRLTDAATAEHAPPIEESDFVSILE